MQLFYDWYSNLFSSDACSFFYTEMFVCLFVCCLVLSLRRLSVCIFYEVEAEFLYLAMIYLCYLNYSCYYLPYCSMIITFTFASEKPFPYFLYTVRHSGHVASYRTF